MPALFAYEAVTAYDADITLLLPYGPKTSLPVTNDAVSAYDDDVS
jgi:hypothetical protein